MKNKIPYVLLVDDDDTTNYINSLTIKKSGIADELFVALNGRDALRQIADRCNEVPTSEKGPVSKLILLDINMPIMNGFEFMEAFRALDAAIQDQIIIIVLSTSLNQRDLDNMKAFGVNGFMNKPLKRETLQAVVDAHFGERIA